MNKILNLLNNLLTILKIKKMNKFEFIDTLAYLYKKKNITISLINDELLIITIKDKNGFNIKIEKLLNNDLDFIKELSYIKEILQNINIIK